MKHLLSALVLAIAALPAWSTPLVSAPVANRYALPLQAAETFEHGPLRVTRHGSGGRPVILVPGMAGGPWVWNDIVRLLQQDQTLYVVTLPGFDGRGNTAGSLAEVQTALASLVSARKMQRPVLIGHSLGGTLALASAARHPNVFTTVISIDGLPVLPGTEELPAEKRPEMARQMRDRTAALTPATFAAQQQNFLRSQGLVDMSRADDLAVMTGRTDPRVVADYLAQIIEMDVRSAMPSMTSNVTLVAPFFEDDNGGQPENTPERKQEYYKELMAGVPKLTVRVVSPARHYAMIDQPQQVVDIIRRHLQER
jgi:pimeloyl-ACP methyl ester carboxylesterase